MKKCHNKEFSVNWLTNSKKDGLIIKGKIKKQKIQLFYQEYIRKYIS